jgi:hypothetical protein
VPLTSAAVHESGNDPRLPTLAMQISAYVGYTGRALRYTGTPP